MLFENTFSTDAIAVTCFLRGLGGEIHLTFEEGTQSAWLFELCLPLVESVLVCDARKIVRRGSKTDRIDARRLSLMLFQGSLSGVYHHDHGTATLSQYVRCYDALVKDQTRIKNRLKALFRARALSGSGARFYGPAHRADWLAKLPDEGHRVRARLLFTQLDQQRPLVVEAQLAVRRQVRGHRAYPILMSVPGFGPLRTAQAIVAIKTPIRFRRARHLWAYAGLSVVMHTSSDYEFKDGQLERRQRRASTRGLVRSCNWQLKAVFKGAAETAIRSQLNERYERLVARGLKSPVAHVVIARWLATVVLALWKKGERFDVNRLVS